VLDMKGLNKAEKSEMAKTQQTIAACASCIFFLRLTTACGWTFMPLRPQPIIHPLLLFLLLWSDNLNAFLSLQLEKFALRTRQNV
jgi:hypothetical protein